MRGGAIKALGIKRQEKKRGFWGEKENTQKKHQNPKKSKPPQKPPKNKNLKKGKS